MSRARVVATTVACGALLVACSSPSDDLPGLTASPTASASATEASTPTPTGAVVEDLSDPDLGIVFDDVPTLEGEPAEVYNWVATYEVEYWRTLISNEVSPGMAVVASAELQSEMQRIATANAGDQAKVGGVLRVGISGVEVTGDSARAVVCDDYGEATFEDVNGVYTPAEAGFGDARQTEVTLGRGPQEGLWTVQTQTRIGTC